jgi:hypothetical protein
MQQERGRVGGDQKSSRCPWSIRILQQLEVNWSPPPLRWVVGFGDAPVESPGHPTKEPGSTETGTHGNRKSPGRGGGGFASTGWEPGSARPAWAGGVLSSDMQLLNEGVRKINVQGMDCEARYLPKYHVIPIAIDNPAFSAHVIISLFIVLSYCQEAWLDAVLHAKISPWHGGPSLRGPTLPSPPRQTGDSPTDAHD